MIFYRTIAVTLALLSAAACTGTPPEAPAPEAPPAEAAPVEAAPAPDTSFKPAAAGKVAFVDLVDGATITSPVHLKFSVESMEVKPAGDLTPNSGHFHVFVDADVLPAGEVVPGDAQHNHYGGGQLEADLTLTPGPHKLVLSFADGLHRSYGPELSQTLNVTVE